MDITYLPDDDPAAMNALVLEAYGTDPVRRSVAITPPGPGQVLVRVEASGLNPLDLKIRDGAAAHARVQPPAILGIDLAGTVAALGEGVTGFAAGDAVYGMTGGIGETPGSLAEYATVDARLLAPRPGTLTAAESAALPLAAVTAWEALVDRARVRAGQSVLVQGGAGGVGSIAVRLAKHLGATVAATGTGHGLDVIRDLGAEPIRAGEESKEYDVVLDTAGGATLDRSFAAVRPYTGHVVSILGWGSHSLAPLSFRGATYSGVFALRPLLTGEFREHHGEILREIARLNILRPLLHPGRFGLDDVAAAYDAVRSRQGKVVITRSRPASSAR